MDLLPEIALAPRILSNYVAALSHNSIKQDLDKFLQTRHQPVNFLAELPGRLRLSPQEVRFCAVACRGAACFFAGFGCSLSLCLCLGLPPSLSMSSQQNAKLSSPDDENWTTVKDGEERKRSLGSCHPRIHCSSSRCSTAAKGLFET